MDTRLNNGMCRCCASEGTFKDICSTYHWMGDEEIYSDMLKECFDINLNTLEAGDEGGICEVCITQLRNASNFKKQVLQTEQHFKKRLQDKLFKTSIVKVELPAPDEEVDSDNDNNISEDFSGPEYEVPIKLETQDEPKGKKRAAKATTSRAKKAKLDDGEPSTKRRRQVQVKNAIKDETTKELSVKVSLKKKVKCIAKCKKGDENNVTLVKITELDKHLTNIKEILKHSNATPIKGYAGIGYMCCFCTNQYQNPSDLKIHTTETHKDASKACFMKDRMFEYCIKLDITALSCKVCGIDIDKLEKLMDHLQDVHDIKLFRDIKNHILPFKFDTESLRCVICMNVFHKFRTLLSHMCCHYKNYVCDVCEAGFVTPRHLSTHKFSHNTGTFNCAFCPKVYNTKQKKAMHEKLVHSTNNKLFKCGYCSEGFKWFHMKEKHLAEVHNVKTSAVKCQACDKTFETRARYTVHMKRDHLMHKPHGCTLCDMKFSDTSKLKNHMITHEGIKKFKCEVCFKAYARKRTLKEHMRIHNNDRRFKCEHCGQAFVQKCSWRGHMRSKHGEIV